MPKEFKHFLASELSGSARREVDLSSDIFEAFKIDWHMGRMAPDISTIRLLASHWNPGAAGQLVGWFCRLFWELIWGIPKIGHPLKAAKVKAS